VQNFTTIFKICISSHNNLSLLLHSSEIWHFPRFFAMFIYMLRCQKIGLWRNFMWTFRKILKFKNGVSIYACTRVSVSIKVRFTWLLPLVSPDNLIKRTCKAAGISYSSVYRVVNGKSPPESNRPKENEMHILKMVVKFCTKLSFTVFKKNVLFSRKLKFSVF
jgi:hypothetical protein